MSDPETRDDIDDLMRMLAARLRVEPDQVPLVLDIPVAGKAAADMSPPQSYRAAAKGSFGPLVRIGSRNKVPTLGLLRRMSGGAVA
jgi:hypothetical protein